jgi:hypothetical protein
MSKSTVLSISEWNVNEIKYMPPKLNDKGGKSINVISKKTNRSLSISTPLMMTWGISDYVDDKDGPNGKFSMAINFPSAEYSTPQLDSFLGKVKEFENQLLDDAVKNSELWFGETMSREVVKHMFFPVLKYPKTTDKDKKKFDYTKSPSIRAKVPNYGGKWGIEVYDTNSNILFPNDNSQLTPIDFIPKRSNVASVLSISQIWIGGKGWGCTVKVVQCIVKPTDSVSSEQGKCQIQLSDEDKILIGDDIISYLPESEPEPIAQQKNITDVQDSDDDEPLSIPLPREDIEPPTIDVMVPKKKVVVKKKAII